MRKRKTNTKSRAEARAVRTGTNHETIEKQGELPNENLKKLPDEAYGDTKIPAEERRTMPD